MTRLEYLKLLRAGYVAIGKPMPPGELRRELHRLEAQQRDALWAHIAAQLNWQPKPFRLTDVTGV